MSSSEDLENFTNISTFSTLLVAVGAFFILIDPVQSWVALLVIIGGLIIAAIDWSYNVRIKRARLRVANQEISERMDEPEGDKAIPQDEPMDDRDVVNYDQVTKETTEEDIEYDPN